MGEYNKKNINIRKKSKIIIKKEIKELNENNKCGVIYKSVPGCTYPMKKDGATPINTLDAAMARQCNVKGGDDDEIEDDSIKLFYEKCEIIKEYFKKLKIFVKSDDVLTSFQYGKKKKWNKKKLYKYLYDGLDFKDIKKCKINLFIKINEYLFKNPGAPARVIGESEAGIKRVFCPLFGAAGNVMVGKMLNYKYKINELMLIYGGKMNRNELGYKIYKMGMERFGGIEKCNIVIGDLSKYDSTQGVKVLKGLYILYLFIFKNYKNLIRKYLKLIIGKKNVL